MGISGSQRSVVIDASVALKWQLEDEQETAQALTLRDDIVIRGLKLPYAPTLYPYEIINGIASAVRQLRLEEAQGKEALQNLFAIPVALRTPDIDRIYGVAFTHSLSAYDSAYVALAEALESELWTADRQLYEATRDTLPRVKWIGNYPT